MPLTQQVGRVAVVLLAVLFGVFVVANAQFVDFSWVFGSTEVVRNADGERLRGGVPLIILMTGSFLLGAAVAGFTVWQVKRARMHRREAAQQRARRPDKP